MHMLQEDKVERAFRTQSDRLSKNTTLFPCLPSFYPSIRAHAKKLKGKRAFISVLRSTDGLRDIPETRMLPGCIIVRKTAGRGAKYVLLKLS